MLKAFSNAVAMVKKLYEEQNEELAWRIRYAEERERARETVGGLSVVEDYPEGGLTPVEDTSGGLSKE